MARHFVIRSTEPLGYMIDGDFARTEETELRVAVGPRIRFVVP